MYIDLGSLDNPPFKNPGSPWSSNPPEGLSHVPFGEYGPSFRVSRSTIPHNMTGPKKHVAIRDHEIDLLDPCSCFSPNPPSSSIQQNYCFSQSSLTPTSLRILQVAPRAALIIGSGGLGLELTTRQGLKQRGVLWGGLPETRETPNHAAHIDLILLLPGDGRQMNRLTGHGLLVA